MTQVSARGGGGGEVLVLVLDQKVETNRSSSCSVHTPTTLQEPSLRELLS